jgi:predicted amidohydrolase YtcJ
MVPNQTLPVGFLLQARTINAAYQLRAEHKTGSIEVGRKADFIVVDRNILTEPVDRIHDTKVLMTFFEGREVFRAPTPLQRSGRSSPHRPGSGDRGA